MLPSSEPGFVDAVLMPMTQALSVVVFAGVAVRLVGRLVAGNSLMRLELVPVLAAAVLRMAATVAFLLARGASPDSELTEWLGAIAFLGTPAISVAFLIGLVRSRAHAARALGKLSGALGRPTARQLKDVIAEAVDDPSLEIVYRTSADPAEWVDDRGRPVPLPQASDNRAATEIRSDGVSVAALVHDPALADAPVMTEVAHGFALMALQNQRLETELRSSLRELQASRSRIMSAADQERRRIERDLHDGAQQRLLALTIELELAGDLVRAIPARVPRGFASSFRTLMPQWPTFGLWPTGSIRASWPNAVWSRRCQRRLPPARFPRPSPRGIWSAMPRDRGRRLLLLSRGASECGQARRRGQQRRDHGVAGGGGPLRGAR